MSETDTQATGAVAPEAAATDTATTQTSEASEQSQGTPEATQSQETSTEVTATDTAQEDKLLAGKYKSVEDLEKSYKELESKYGKEASERAELTKILNEAFMPPVTATQATDTGYDDVEDSTATSTTSVSDKKVAILEFILTHNDANAEEMSQILKSDPMINKITGEDAKLEYAYLRAQSMGRDKALAEATKTAQAQVHAKVAEKQAAQVETAQRTEQVDEDSELFNRATGNYSQEDRDKARRELIRKKLVNL